MKNISKLIVPLAGFLAALLLGACDVAFDGPQYHFKLVNKTMGTIQNVTIGAWPCGEMVPGRSCTAPYMTAPGSITVQYQSAVTYGVQDTFEVVFTPDSSEVFDEQNLYLDNGYFALAIENHTTDDEALSIDYLITGFAVSPDGADFTEEYTLDTAIDNDEVVHFLGFYDRKDDDIVDDEGIVQFGALVDNGVLSADWTVTDLETNILHRDNSDGGSYYAEVVFHAPLNWEFE